MPVHCEGKNQDLNLSQYRAPDITNILAARNLQPPAEVVYVRIDRFNLPLVGNALTASKIIWALGGEHIEQPAALDGKLEII